MVLRACALVTILVAATSAQDTFSMIGSFLPRSFTDNFDEIIKSASKTCEGLPLLGRTYSYELPYTDFVDYTRTSRQVYRVTAAHEHLKPEHSSEVIIYIPGWLNTPTDESTRAVVKALLWKYHRVLALDTCPSFCRGYVSSVSSVTPLAHLLYNFINKLQRNNYPISSIHIIGFSLGAHVAGITGKLVQKRLKVKLGTITALDPAKPCFTRVGNGNKLSPTDAKFVQVIHSNSGVLGLEDPIGHVDVYLNGVSGKHPECKDRKITVECDHAQAWRLYSASVVDETKLTGRQCSSWDQLVREKCTGNDTILGYSIRSDAKGIYLYKSKNEPRDKRQEPERREVKIFNPLELLLWPILSNTEKERRLN